MMIRAVDLVGVDCHRGVIVEDLVQPRLRRPPQKPLREPAELPKARVPEVANQDGGQEGPGAMTHRQACAAEQKQTAPVMLLGELPLWTSTSVQVSMLRSWRTGATEMKITKAYLEASRL